MRCTFTILAINASNLTYPSIAMCPEDGMARHMTTTITMTIARKKKKKRLSSENVRWRCFAVGMLIGAVVPLIFMMKKDESRYIENMVERH